MVAVTKKNTQKREMTTATLTAIQALTVASVAITLLLFTLSAELTLPLNASFWLIITYLVLFCTLFAFFVQNYAVRKISPTKVSLLMGSEPLFGAMFAMLWLGEDFTILQLIGGILILVSVIFASLQNN
jgi:drug/metabolite transporter (DMT)-like permease